MISTVDNNMEISLTAPSEHSIYDHCQIASIDAEFQLRTCERLNLQFFKPNKRIQTNKSQRAACRSLEKAILTQTGKTHVLICSIAGDGNCLFRALSQAVTGSQDQHLLFRAYIVNHMLDSTVKNAMKQLFVHKKDQNCTFENYLINMERPGVWGTEQEIASAASLLQCSIICHSKYSSNRKFCLQHFPPHFVSSSACNSTCLHPSIYIVNTSGTHYETAVVTQNACKT